MHSSDKSCCGSLIDLESRVGEVAIIQVKLTLQGPIRDAPLALQHPDRLIQDFLKRHRLSLKAKAVSGYAFSQALDQSIVYDLPVSCTHFIDCL